VEAPLRRREDSDFLLYLAENGLPLAPAGAAVIPCYGSNYKSCAELNTNCIAHLRKEIEAGRMFRRPPGLEESTTIHSCGATPKGTPITAESTVRFLHDHSRPVNKGALNEHIKYLVVSAGTVEEAAGAVHAAGLHCWLARVDIKDFYRNLPVDPFDWARSAMQYDLLDGQGMQTLWDAFLQFGVRHGPEVGQRIANAVKRRLIALGCTSAVVAIMDDYLIVSPTMRECMATYKELIKLLLELGLPINYGPGKTM
jgi:hypothetical protein